jgi:predicted nucleotidyltransferase
VFGSVARDEVSKSSDLDLLVDLEDGRSLFDHAAMLLELKELLGREVDVVTSRGLRPRIRERVMAEAIPL